MKRTKPISIASVLIIIAFINIITKGISGAYAGFTTIFFGIVIFSLAFLSKSNKKNNPSKFKDYDEHRYEDYTYHQAKSHECEYCGHSNPVEREYCENCGAKQLLD